MIFMNLIYLAKKNKVMSYVKLMVHAVWGTKNRERILTEQPKKILLQHIKENAVEKEIYIDTINGEPESRTCGIYLL